MNEWQFIYSLVSIVNVTLINSFEVWLKKVLLEMSFSDLYMFYIERMTV